jgi:hypothetical protein
MRQLYHSLLLPVKQLVPAKLPLVGSAALSARHNGFWKSMLAWLAALRGTLTEGRWRDRESESEKSHHLLLNAKSLLLDKVRPPCTMVGTPAGWAVAPQRPVDVG